MAIDVVCAYPISGGYGTIPRMIYYVLLVVPLVFHTSEWLVDATLGASMIFSSITAVHTVALASTAGRGTVDLDIIPAYSITGVAMLLGVPLLLWSRMLREATRALRIVAVSWIVVMFVGSIASLASVKLLSISIGQCDTDPTMSEAALCTITCDVTLPMRRTQQASLIPFPAYNELLKCWPIPFSFIAAFLTFVGLAHASARVKSSHVVNNPTDTTSTGRSLYSDIIRHLWRYTICAPPMSAALSIAHVVLLENIILGKPGVPIGEDVTAIGQWGPLVGSAFAVLVSIFQWTIDQRDEGEHQSPSRRDTAETLTGPSNDPEKDGVHSNYNSESSQTAPVRNVEARRNPLAYFEEGAWWGTGANGLVMNYRGATWVVHEGYVRRTSEPASTITFVNDVSSRTQERRSTLTETKTDNVALEKH
ncbi:hypothetical protein BDN70DRAFT_922771 [Pholiota conissans]|uniref:Uncharacterized protein n=1 Tax=Pholiota conissans TaxID=109636 RepID=A0A9P5YWW7_9AGAR|nr:hypothetical protein BDN70DRAFT_922771 [Pholiota conissans]